MDLQSRESDMILNPDIGFIKASVMDLKKEGKCYAYTEYQAEEIQRRFMEKYKRNVNYEKKSWYYVISICK